MTPEELKKAIDILAGQGNQVDLGGQLKDILQALAMPSKNLSIIGKKTSSPYHYDCSLLAKMKSAEEQGRALNLVVGLIDADDLIFYSVAYASETQLRPNGINIVFNYPYTSLQYEGLAAIQDAAENYDAIPDLAVNSRGELVSVGDIDDYITSGTYILIPTIENGKIASIAKSQYTDPDCTDISWEDVQKLIGLPIQA